jgi:phosphoribosylaminoimidazole (AIR) synthetase
MAEYLTYAKSGVDIDANDVMVDRIRSSVKALTPAGDRYSRGSRDCSG